MIRMSKSKETLSPNERASAAQQISLSLFVVGGSMIGGMYLTARKEKVKLRNIVGVGTPAILAGKALLIASVYCIGSFAVGTGLFVMVSGLTSIKDLGGYVDRSFRTPEGYRLVLEKRERARQEQEALRGKYTHLSEVDLLWKQLRLEVGLLNEKDEEDEKIISSPEMQRVLVEARRAQKEKEAQKEHVNVVLVAVTNLKKALNTVGSLLFGIGSESAERPSEATSSGSGSGSGTAPSSALVLSGDNLLVRKWNKLVGFWASDDQAQATSSSDHANEHPPR